MAQTLNKTGNHEDFLATIREYAATALTNQDQELSASLQRRQIPPTKIKPLAVAYQISFKLSENIALNSIKNQLLQQIDTAAYFLRDFHLGILGQRQGLFQIYEIEIVIEPKIKYSLKFEAGRLSIQLPYCQLKYLNRYFKYQELKNRWHRGEHLAKFSPIRKVWWLFNPIGEFRSNLRATLWLTVQQHIFGIDQLLVKWGLLDLSEYPSLVQDHGQQKTQSFKDSTIAFLKASVNEEKLGVNLETILQNQDDATLEKLLSLFKKNLADSGQMEELIDTGIFMLQEVIQEEQSQVDIKMFGFVNVGNYHRIDVVLNLSTGYLKKYVELIPRKAEVKAVQLGFVNVYTIDDITVKPSFHSAMKIDFETAALERTLRELELVK